LGLYLLTLVFWAAPRLVRAVRRPSGLLAECSFGPLFALALVAYWLYVGGDNFDARFLLITIPVGIAVLMDALLRDCAESVRLFVFAAALFVPLAPIVWLDQFGKTFAAKYDHRIVLGRFLKRMRPGTVLATTAAGKVPYFSELRTIDMLGLCDAHIGHEPATEFIPGHSKRDMDYVLARNPDLFFVGFDGDGVDFGDLPEERYRRAGYRIHYLVNTGPESRGSEDIIDVLGRPREEITLLAHEGWRSAVLERDLPSPIAQP
jgi:hypothetical protein